VPSEVRNDYSVQPSVRKISYDFKKGNGYPSEQRDIQPTARIQFNSCFSDLVLVVVLQTNLFME
jgi:hypothetical protein